MSDTKDKFTDEAEMMMRGSVDVTSIAAFGRSCAAEAYEDAAKSAYCLASQLPGQGDCNNGDDGDPCLECLAASRLEAKARALRPDPQPHDEREERA